MQSEIKETDTAKTMLQHFDSWYEFVNTSIKGDTDMEYSTRSSRDNDYSHKRYEWSLGLDWEGACDMAHNGWLEKAGEAERLAEPLLERLTSRIERPEWTCDMTGDAIDIGRYCGGYPDCFQQVSFTTVEGTGNRIIHIVANLSVSCAISATTLFNRGVALVALIHLLELAGYRCQVDIVTSSEEHQYKGKTYQLFTFIPAKSSDDMVSLPFLMFALAHPATFRRLWFSIAEQLPSNWRQRLNIGGCYGHPAEAPEDMRGDLYFNSILYGGEYPVDWDDTNAVFDWLMKQLKNFNVELKGE